MIRIDAIYEETFWPWIQTYHPSTRMFWCQPFGHPGVQNLLSKSPANRVDTYVFFHDQAPVDSDIYNTLFAAVKDRNRLILRTRTHTEPGIIVVSEKGSEVAKMCGTHGWLSCHYFFYGWAALDWYRGYNRSYCLLNPTQRDPTKTSVCADHVMGGENTWQDVHESLVCVVKEKVSSGERLHLTEKTFRPIALGMPFLLLSTAGSLEYLRSYGFQSFGHLWSEDYDSKKDDATRLASVTSVLQDLDNLSINEKKQLWQHCLPIIIHNWNWFYHGGFERVLWRELTDMLKQW